MALLKYLLFTFFFIFSMAQAPDTNPPEEKTSLQSLEQPLTWTSYRVIAATTALVVVAAGAAGLGAFVLPLLAYKVCYLLGSCDKSFFFYVDRFMEHRQKRSVEYVGPVLQALSAAYEKYGEGKSQEKPIFYAR